MGVEGGNAAAWGPARAPGRPAVGLCVTRMSVTQTRGARGRDSDVLADVGPNFSTGVTVGGIGEVGQTRIEQWQCGTRCSPMHQVPASPPQVPLLVQLQPAMRDLAWGSN